MTAVEEASKYAGLVVLPGHNSVFENRTGRTGHRWDGSMLDCVFKDAGINTVSFTNPSTAFAVLTQNGKVRKRNRPRIGDVAFLAAENYVGLVIGLDDKYHARIRIGWRPADQGKRAVTIMRVHNTIDVLAYADPVLPVRLRDVPVELPSTRLVDSATVSSLLHNHPAVGEYATGRDLIHAYARWQRYCGYGPDKANGSLDDKSLARLAREERGRP